MSKTEKNKILKNLVFIYICVFFILLLSALNIHAYSTITYEKDVLGANTAQENDLSFWFTFLEENPEYIPGWIEIGDSTTALSLDPNFIIP